MDLARGLLAAVITGVLPGYFWAGFVRRTDGLAERIAYSAAISMATVPAIAVLLARLTGTGVSLLIALASVVAVAGSGALACRICGPAGGSAAPALPRPRAVRDPRVLAVLIVGLALALAVSLGLPAPGWLLTVILVAVAVAGLATRGTAALDPTARDPVTDPATGIPAGAAPEPAASPSAAARPLLGRAVRAPALAVILVLTVVRGYAGVVGQDWPFVRGQDQFSHAVMAEQMLAHGSYATYLVYPPGFSTLSAVISRLSGLPPLSLFPVVTPALLLLTTLAAYALATRLWGWEYGLAAAALSGLVLIGPYVSFAGGLYPDLLAAFFLMVMVVAGLADLYQAPSARAGLLVTVVGAAVVLFHSVGTLYLVLLLAAVAVVCLPYLALRAGPQGRRTALTLTLSLAGLGVLSLAYAWHIYGLDPLLSGRGITASQVSLDVGSQSVLDAGDLLAWVGSPVIWLGVFGFAALTVTVRYLRRPDQVATTLTLLLWCAVMYLGSRTAVDGFPQRFERDVGAPLSILAALGVGMVLMSLVQPALARPALSWPMRTWSALARPARAWPVLGWSVLARRGGTILASLPPADLLPPDALADDPVLAGHGHVGAMLASPVVEGDDASHAGTPPGRRLLGRRLLDWSRLRRPPAAAALAVAVVVVFSAVQAGSDLRADTAPSREVLPRPVAAAGAWLRRHNTGGTIISTPDLNRGLTNRAVLAMGGYAGLQSYPEARVEHPRSLPTAGRGPLLDSRQVLLNPAACLSGRILAADDVRFVFLYRQTNEANYGAFARDPQRYKAVYQNQSVIIYAPRHGATPGC
jgi:hypothetical protein